MLSNKPFAWFMVAVLLLNFTFNLGANYVLADYYAVLGITASIWFLLNKVYWRSFVALFASLLFQNLAYLLFPIWFGVIFWNEKDTVINVLTRKDIKKVFIIALKFGVSGFPYFLWLGYKFVNFGNPLYTNIKQFGLLNPNFDSVIFYVQNSLVIFSFVLIPLAIYILWHPKKLIRSRVLLFYFIGLTLNVLFWIVFYDWDDRRFLLYFIPWLYPIIAWFLYEVSLAVQYKIVLMVLMFYPTILPVSSFFTTNEIPVFHNIYLKGVVGSPDGAFSIESRPEFSDWYMNLFPAMYLFIGQTEMYRDSESTWYTKYEEYVDTRFNQDEYSICIDTENNIRKYIVSSVLLIKYNSNLNEVSFYDCP